MANKVIITCAVTGAIHTPSMSPYLPVTPEEIAHAAIGAAKAGAAIVHLHAREPKDGRPTQDPKMFLRFLPKIKAASDVVINLTTGPGARFLPGTEDPWKPGPATNLKNPAERVKHVVELRPEICSLDMGSMNMGGYAFINTQGYLEAMAVAIRDAGIVPELEVFEAGHLLLARRMIETGHIKPPGMFQICLGISWGQPATPEAMTYMRGLLPQNSPWFAFGISLHQFPMVAQAVLLGGHPRVGMEDNIYLEKGKLAPSNAALVEKAGKIIQILGDEIATPADARQMLSIGANA